ncbi:MAG: NAD-dependent epimerase/dehydratase family protein [Metallosphaera yellowstonensis]|jgi:UDP-glucose 4-epimerase|uniref:Nucleoside-diphosphate-sugar epimerase n=1 Tax=Metallosphaera yellowstonensis MK1 TaxID=671065 RepID=H2C625_9CREN|nr:NAD-dependent epimerase/dehydratase family protein [Metallosphaera yellowstonensis]EHP69252.1 nucleoside-diphosphate-sugar epimerase [Metallosphaera yellowstonensis MK1]
MVSVVTGGAGYIGGHLVDRLVELGENVVSLDDFSSGSYVNKKAKIIRIDLRTEIPSIEDCQTIYHLAANPDVRTSMQDIEEHFSRDVKVTLNTLEMARRSDCSTVFFFSSSTVYGEASRVPTPETEIMKPISNYGLFKLLGEEMTEYYSRTYGMRAVSLRLANITGGRVSHGVVVDFVRKLRRNPSELEILGNGKQRKSYLYVQDLIDAVLLLNQKFKGNYDAFNVGNDDWVTVEEIARIVEGVMGLTPKHIYVDDGSGRGWAGDVRFMLLDIQKLKGYGWRPSMGSAQVIERACKDLLEMWGSVKI